jgi:hypothetical protein
MIKGLRNQRWFPTLNNCRLTNIAIGVPTGHRDVEGKLLYLNFKDSGLPTAYKQR